MSCPIDQEEINKLKLFIGFCSQKPDILNLPQLSFFKDFVEKLGGKVPPSSESDTKQAESEKPESNPQAEPETEEIESEESDVDIDNSGCVEPDNEPPQEMGDPDKTPNDEEIEQATQLRSEAATHYSEQRYEDAVAKYEQAILLNPKNALYHAKRGQAYLKLNKPNACIRDCNRALELNPDSAAAYKFRGRAYRLLGDWEAAAKDLRQAVKIDYDEETDEWLREVQPAAKKLEAHKIKQERKKLEREERLRQERIRRAKEANKKAAEEQQKKATTGESGDAGASFGNFSQADLLDAFKDPEVAAAFQDIMSNPANVVKYQSNPKIMNIITKIGSAMGGGMGGGFPGAGGFPGFPGAASFPGAGGFPGAPPSNNASKPPSDFQDDGLD